MTDETEEEPLPTCPRRGCEDPVCFDQFKGFCSPNCLRKAKRDLDKKPLPWRWLKREDGNLAKLPAGHVSRRDRRAQQRSNRREGREIAKANAQKAARKAKKVAETQEDKVG